MGYSFFRSFKTGEISEAITAASPNMSESHFFLETCGFSLGVEERQHPQRVAEGVSIYCEFKGLILNASSVPSTLLPPHPPTQVFHNRKLHSKHREGGIFDNIICLSTAADLAS